MIATALVSPIFGSLNDLQNSPPSLDIAVSLLSRLYKISRESGLGHEKRVILVGNKTDLARNREVSSKVLLLNKIHNLMPFYLYTDVSRRVGTQPFFMDQSLLKLGLELDIILINY